MNYTVAPDHRCPRVYCARTGIFRGKLSVHIIFKNNNIVLLGEGEDRPLTCIRHNKSEGIIAVRNQNHPFNRPLIQRQLQRFNADPCIRIGWDLYNFDP